MGANPGLDLGPHAKEYNAAYRSQSHNEHADLVEENLAIPGLRSTLFNHLKHGDLLQSRPLPRAWRLATGNYAGRRIGSRKEDGALPIA